MIAYVDASVFLRFILGQPDRLHEAGAMTERYSSVLTRVECLRALDVARVSGRYTDEELAGMHATAHDMLARTELVELSPSILERACAPLPTRLATLEALHIATALRLRERAAPQLALATHDHAMGLAARALGFTVVGT